MRLAALRTHLLLRMHVNVSVFCPSNSVAININTTTHVRVCYQKDASVSLPDDISAFKLERGLFKSCPLLRDASVDFFSFVYYFGSF